MDVEADEMGHHVTFATAGTGDEAADNLDVGRMAAINSDGDLLKTEHLSFHDALTNPMKGPLRPAATNPPSPTATDVTALTSAGKHVKTPLYPHIFRVVRGKWPTGDRELRQFSRDATKILALGSGKEAWQVEMESAQSLGEESHEVGDEATLGSPRKINIMPCIPQH